MIPDAPEPIERTFRGRRLTFVFTVRRQDASWLVQDSYGAILASAPRKDAAIQSARRAAILMSETGVRVIVMLENQLGEFDPVFTAASLPRDAGPMLLS